MENFNQYCLPQKDFMTYNGDSLPLLKSLINKLDKCFEKDNNNFAEVCFIVYRIKLLFDKYNEVHFWGSSRKLNSYSFDTIMTGFGISKSESSRLLSIFKKFCCLSNSDLDIAKCVIIEDFKGFSKTKLFELLQVDNEQLIKDLQNKVLRFDFTIKQIRDYVKNLQNLEKQQAKLSGNDKEEKEEIIEEDIPMAYNPQQHYDFEYFQDKNKAQLLNIVWELQKEYEKLKTSYNKLKKEKMQNG